MRILRRPPQHTILATLVLIAIPVFWLNLWIVQKGALLKFLQSGNTWWVAAQAVWVLMTLLWLLRIKRRGFWSFSLLATVTLLGNLYALVVTKNYALAFYALFILILAVIYSAHLYRTLRESYYDSGQHWYEGNPRFLPRIEAYVGTGENTVLARLSRLGSEGCYAFSDGTHDFNNVSDIRLKLGELELNCAVELVSTSDDGRGGGLRFVSVSADQEKDIRDFIDRVRSSGYVS
jgi:hypothetical protein